MDVDRLDLLWEYIAGCFSDIPHYFQEMLDFAADHRICISIFICFLISAAVIVLKRLISVYTR